MNINSALFISLFAAHAVADFLIQTEWEAKNKAKVFSVLFRHCFTYAVILTIAAALVMGITPRLLYVFLIMLVTHVLLDNRKFIYWWLKTVNRLEKPQEAGWLLIEVDQGFHYIVLFITACIFA